MFLAGLGKGVNVDFTKRKLVGIGHSMGAISLYVPIFFVDAWLPALGIRLIIITQDARQHAHASDRIFIARTC